MMWVVGFDKRLVCHALIAPREMSWCHMRMLGRGRGGNHSVSEDSIISTNNRHHNRHHQYNQSINTSTTPQSARQLRATSDNYDRGSHSIYTQNKRDNYIRRLYRLSTEE
jgi:hypothetical protein